MIEFLQNFWGAFVVGIPTLIGVIYTVWQNTKQQRREGDAQNRDNLTTRWMEYATEMEKRSANADAKISEHDRRLNELSTENRSIRLTIIELRADRDESFYHNKQWWDWYDRGQNPPAPSRPNSLVTKVENLIQGDRIQNNAQTNNSTGSGTAPEPPTNGGS